ncbi:MAG TPA: zf-HC2 domain-containing protein [Longimicrobiales bacterium]|nr:zf-HC2 domain-containing protein [Longimicrobiales bacterium]
MLSCRDCLARHSEYLDGRLEDAAAEAMRAHLAVCPRCARYDRVLRRGLQALDAQPALHLAPDFEEQLQARIAFESRRAELRPIRSMATASVAVAAMLALAAWIPVVFVASQESQPLSVVQSAEASPVVSEIAWHGEDAMDERQQHVHLVRRLAWKPAIEDHVISPRYTPVIVESPTAPLNYTQAAYAE